MAEGEDAAKGLFARALDADNSALSHVAGRKESCWISTTKDKAIAMEKYGQNGVVSIDLNKVPGEVVDVSNGFENGGRFTNYAKHDQEVLIKGHVPPEAITVLR